LLYYSTIPLCPKRQSLLVSNKLNEAIVYMCNLCRQMLKDLKNQEKKQSRYDYEITIPEYRVKELEQRETCLGW